MFFTAFIEIFNYRLSLDATVRSSIQMANSVQSFTYSEGRLLGM